MKIYPDLIGQQTELLDVDYTVNVFPNPSFDEVNFTQTNTTDECYILIHSANGMLITESRFTGKFRWEIQENAPGIYFATLKIGNYIIKHQRIIHL